MSYIDRNLIPGETLLYRAGLHWIVLVVPGAIAAICALLGLVVILNGGDGAVAAFLLAFAAALAGFAWLRRQSVEMGVTNKRVLTKSGILSRHTLELLLTKVESIGLEEALIGRMLGYGTVVVKGTGGTPERFLSIAQPAEFRRQVQQQIEATEKRPEMAGAR